MNENVFLDAVHGYMVFHPVVVRFINTKQVQRLRNIKQLGVCYHVFPSASHNRFEHSLGTAYLAGQIYDRITNKLRYNDQMTRLAVQIAALCHDLGHGPFSHTWEKFLERVAPERKWKHEEESANIFEGLVRGLSEDTSTEEVNIGDYTFSERLIQDIKNMILGINKEPKKVFFQIINNADSGVDVDKWDYLARDSLMLNVPTGFDYPRLMRSLDIYENKQTSEFSIGYDQLHNILDMFLARQKLHDLAYQNHTVIIIEEMLLDALELANETLKLSTTPVVELTDHIYYKILYEDFEGDEKMKKAKHLLQRIESKDLYRCIASFNYGDHPPSDTKIMQNLGGIPEIHNFLKDIGICKTKNLISNGYIGEVLENLLGHDAKDLSRRAEDYLQTRRNLNTVLILYKNSRQPLPDLLEERIKATLNKVCKEQSTQS